jgi:SLT domain-containing protein
MADAIVQGRSLEDVLAGLGQQLAKYILQQMIIGPMFAAIGLPGFAEGGVVTRPTIATIGEGGVPEAVIPMPSGAVPVEFSGKMATAGQAQTAPEITMVNLLDKSQLDEIATENLAKNKDIVINHFFRDMDERGLTLTALRRG